MISLDRATRSLQASLETSLSNPGIEYVASWESVRPESIDPETNSGQTVSSGSVTVIPAPTDGYPRKVVFLSFRNGGASTARLSLILADGSSLRTIYRFLLASQDTLFYEHNRGFYVLDSDGNTKSGSTSGGGSGGGTSGMEAWGHFTITSGNQEVDITISGLTSSAVVSGIPQDGSIGNAVTLRYICSTNNLKIRSATPAGAAGITGSYHVRSLDGS